MMSIYSMCYVVCGSAFKSLVFIINLLFVCRYTSESSVSLNRSPGQPSSYRSDEEMMAVLDSLRGGGVDG